VAKRIRGTHAAAAYRPGGAPPVRPTTSTSSPRPGTQPPAAIPGAPPRASQLDAAVLIADDIEAGRPAAAATELRVASHQPGRTKVKSNSLLAARAAQEYIYVGQDLRRIAVVAAGLFIALGVLWVLFVTLDPFGLY
jgi:hypothetical protein